MYQVEAVTAKYEAARREHAQREDETAKIMDVRNHQINKLELQLRDIAYGTRQVKIEPVRESENPADYNINLERGQVRIRFWIRTDPSDAMKCFLRGM